MCEEPYPFLIGGREPDQENSETEKAPDSDSGAFFVSGGVLVARGGGGAFPLDEIGHFEEPQTPELDRPWE